MLFNFKSGIVHGLKRKSGLKPLLLIAVLGLLQGCASSPDPNRLTGFTISGRSSLPANCLDTAGNPRPCTAAETDALLFAEIGKEITVTAIGGSACTSNKVDFGDETRVSLVNGIAKHTYTTWPGLKLIRIKGDSGYQGCLGSAAREIRVGIGPDGRDFRLGLCYGAVQCGQPPGSIQLVCKTVLPNNNIAIRKGSLVTIATNGRTINYGPSGIGTSYVFNASGSASLPTPPGYRFPNRKKFSLVYRVGTEDFQGEAGAVTFAANQSGVLEVCTNDNPQMLNDNVGDMMLTIAVDERNAE